MAVSYILKLLMNIYFIGKVRVVHYDALIIRQRFLSRALTGNLAEDKNTDRLCWK